MPDLTRLQVSQPVQLVDANDLNVCDITTVSPSGTTPGIVVRNIPSGIQVVSSDVSQVSNQGTAVVPKYAAFGVAASGDNTLISAVTNKKIRIIAMMGVVSASTNIYFTSGAGGSVIFGGSTNKINLSANSGFVLPLNELGWFETASESSLVVNLSASNSFSGGITYLEI